MTLAQLVRKSFGPGDGGLEIKPDTAGQRKVNVVVSTGDVDRDGDTISPSGWDLDVYAKNPIVLWGHDATRPPIAKAESIAVVGNQLRATAAFPPEGTYPFADTIYGLVQHGFVKGLSVGFKPLDGRPAPGREKGIDFVKQTLLEFSFVPIPANPHALVQAKNAGIDVTPIVEWAAKVLVPDGVFKEAITEWKKAGGLNAPERNAAPIPVSADPSTTASATTSVQTEQSITAGGAGGGAPGRDAGGPTAQANVISVVRNALSGLVSMLALVEGKSDEPETLKHEERDGRHVVVDASGGVVATYSSKSKAMRHIAAHDAVSELRMESAEFEIPGGVSIEDIEKACPECATSLKEQYPGVTVVKKLSGKALAGLCKRFGRTKGFRTRCMASSLKGEMSTPGAFCNWLKMKCHGKASLREKPKKEGEVALVTGVEAVDALTKEIERASAAVSALSDFVDKKGGKGKKKPPMMMDDDDEDEDEDEDEDKYLHPAAVVSKMYAMESGPQAMKPRTTAQVLAANEAKEEVNRKFSAAKWAFIDSVESILRGGGDTDMLETSAAEFVAIVTPLVAKLRALEKSEQAVEAAAAKAAIEDIEKAGRVLSRSNEGKLRQALGALSAVLSQASPQDDGDEFEITDVADKGGDDLEVDVEAEAISKAIASEVDRRVTAATGRLPD